MLFFLLLKHKSLALTISMNKRERSSMGTRLVTLFLFCNKRVWKEQYGCCNDPLDQHTKSVLQVRLWCY